MAHPQTALDDAALVGAAQAGDAGAFEELFRRHYTTVRRVCARRLASLSDADEVAQAAFVRAYERIGQCTDERRFGAWVQVIAFRLCADWWRARDRITPMADPPAAEDRMPVRDSCEEALLRREQVAEVRRALDTLPRRQREVLVARDLEGRRPREVAAALAVSVGAVDSLLLRARRRMVASFRAAGVEAGGVSPEVSAASLAATSVASSAASLARPAGRLLQSVAAALDAAGAGVASAFGLGPATPTVAQRVAGLVGAGVLAVAPLAAGPPGHEAAWPPPPVSIPLALPVDRLTGGLVLPPGAPPSLAVPGVSPGAAPPAPGMPDTSSAPALPAVPPAPGAPGTHGSLPAPAVAGDPPLLSAEAAVGGDGPGLASALHSVSSAVVDAAATVSALVEELAAAAASSDNLDVVTPAVEVAPADVRAGRR